MAGFGYVTKLLLVLNLSHGLWIITSAEKPICCFPKQFESFMHAVNTGTGDGGEVGAGFAMANGTIRTAYDAINRRTYLFTKYSQLTSDDPESFDVNITKIQDYKTNVYYQVIIDVLCQHGRINSNLFIECIPDNATLVGQGALGDSNTMVETYLMKVTLYGDYQVVVSVIHTDVAKGECIPVRYSLTNFPPDEEADVTVSDIYDVTRGIKDTSIFTPPPVCNHTRQAFPGRN